MAWGCSNVRSTTATERGTVRTALLLNMSVAAVVAAAGWLAQSTGVLADALDTLTDAISYALALWPSRADSRSREMQPGGSVLSSLCSARELSRTSFAAGIGWVSVHATFN